ncbi:MAG: hypothetical protein OEZ08_04940 [Betaproteobacteria bacterium]|nr:hypothetical protein [Betaproteobacteria bacterium]
MTPLATMLQAPGALVECDDDPEAVFELLCAKGWSDGLPVIPPTPERVERMLAYCDRDIEAPIVKIPPRYGAATPIRVAANAVMAGCKPNYFPLVLLALEAMAEEQYNLYGTQATTHPCTPMLIFNGPVAKEVGINAGNNAMGNYFRANAAIGRAVRLALVNIGAAIPGVGDMATAGTPAKFTFCVAENEDASPWEPLHVELGFPQEASTVTVVAAEGPHNVNDHESLTAEGILVMVAGTMAITGSNNAYYDGQPVLAFGPEHAATVAGDGMSKAEVKRWLFDRASLPMSKFSKEGIERRFRRKRADKFANAPLDTPVRMVGKPEDLIVIVTGGAGKHSQYVPTFGNTRAATRVLKRADGQVVKSIHDLRRA